MTNRNKGDGGFAATDVGGVNFTGGDTRRPIEGTLDEQAITGGDTRAPGDPFSGGDTFTGGDTRDI